MIYWDIYSFITRETRWKSAWAHTGLWPKVYADDDDDYDDDDDDDVDDDDDDDDDDADSHV